MSRLFSRLPPPPPRKFVPKKHDPSDLKAWLKLYQDLMDRPLNRLKDIARWWNDVQEVGVVLGEYEAMTYIKKSVNTRDRKALKAYLHVIQTLAPGLATIKDQINQRLLDHPLRERYPKRWSLMLKMRQNSIDLFKEKNVPLEKRSEEVAQEYSQLMGGLSVVFEGKKQTLTQMGVYLERSDGSLREKAWLASAKCRYQVRAKVDSIYSRLVKIRHQIARNAGFKNFRDYCHRRYDRFDYQPSDCYRFHDAVEEVVVPAVRKIHARKALEMGKNHLKPWDLVADPLGRAPLKPFEDGKQLAQLCKRVFMRVDPILGRQFDSMIRYGVLDLDNRAGKEPGGYQYTLPEHQLPFIFMNAVGRDTDIRTLLHEGGHAFHMLASKDDPLVDYRSAPIEFCEVASMGMELLANRGMMEIYRAPADLKRSSRMLFEGTLEVLPWVATIDAFQHWIYTHPGHSLEDRKRAWMSIRRRFSDGTDWKGLEKYEEVLWHRQLHLFGIPFYYIEYGMAQLGALMVWRNSLKNPKSALSKYRRALSLGGSTGLPKLYETAGGVFKFNAKTMKPLVHAVLSHIDL